MIRVARVVLIASLALWVGGLSTISFVVAPSAFKVERPVAGKIVGASLRTFGTIEIVCGALAVASSVFLRIKTARGTPVAALVIVMVMITLVYVCAIYPAAGDAREQMNRPDGHEISAKERFDTLHRASVALVGTNILLGAVALTLASASRPDGP